MNSRENSGWRMVTTLAFAALLIPFFVGAARAQDEKSRQSSAPTVTAVAATERVRFTAPASVTRIQLQVFGESGEMLFDATNKGNVLDWTLQDGVGQHLGNGSYLCVVTVKSLSGKLSQRIGSISVEEKTAELKQMDATQLTSAQQQAVGPIEENAALTILKPGAGEATTLLAHDGNDGSIVRGHGALSFRVGDFFTGADKEQMRLTEEGNLGIGTDKPEAKLDVAGMIRARDGLMFSDGSTLKVNEKGVLTRTSADGASTRTDGASPSAVTSTQNRIAKFTDNAGTLGDSVITEASGNIGLGTSSPQAALHVVGNQFLKPLGATPTYKVLAGSDPTTTVMLTTDGSAFGWQIAPSNAVNDTIVQVLGQSFAAVPNRGEFGIYLGADSNSAFKVIQRGGPELMRVNRDGSVGIGTTTPAARLDVAGNINTSTQYRIGGTRVFSIAGSNNTFVGSGAGNANTTGSENAFFGSSAGANNTSGTNNSFFGHNAGQSNTTGGANSFFGRSAGQSNTTGNFNSFFGQNAGALNTTGGLNSFFGHGAGQSNTTANNNSFFGTFAGFFNTTGDFNSFFGTRAGQSNTTGGSNSFFGQAGISNTTGFDNSFFGKDAGIFNTTGADNSFFGQNAGFGNVNGEANSFFGQQAGKSNASGGFNSFFGASAGFSNTTEKNNTFLGASSDGAAGITNATAIGSHAKVTQSNSLVLGSINGINLATADTNVGIGTTAPTEKLHVSGGNVRWANSQLITEQGGSLELGGTTSLAGTGIPYIDFHFGPVGGPQDFNTRIINDADGRLTIFGLLKLDTLGAGSTSLCLDNDNIISSCSSSIRFKDHVLTLRSGLDVVHKLRPVSFRWKAGGQNDVGLIAEEVNQVEPLLVTRNKQGEIQGVKYDRLNVVLLNAIKEQQQQLQQKHARIEKLEARLAALETAVKNISVRQRPRR